MMLTTNAWTTYIKSNTVSNQLRTLHQLAGSAWDDEHFIITSPKFFHHHDQHQLIFLTNSVFYFGLLTAGRIGFYPETLNLGWN